MNTAWLYHRDGSECVDRWSCQDQDHTSVPPRCGAAAAGRPIGCELPKGHPGPHLHFADLERCGAGAEDPRRPGVIASRRLNRVKITAELPVDAG